MRSAIVMSMKIVMASNSHAVMPTKITTIFLLTREIAMIITQQSTQAPLIFVTLSIMIATA